MLPNCQLFIIHLNLKVLTQFQASNEEKYVYERKWRLSNSKVWLTEASATKYFANLADILVCSKLFQKHELHVFFRRLNLRDEEGKTALHYVSQTRAEGALTVAELLLESGCDTGKWRKPVIMVVFKGIKWKPILHSMSSPVYIFLKLLFHSVYCPSRHNTLNQCWFNVGPPSNTTVDQR